MLEDPIRLRERCEALSDADLVNNLTLAQDDNSAAFADEARAELARRGLSLDEWIDNVTVQTGPAPAQAATIRTAVETVQDTVPRRAVASFTHCLGQTLIVQREGWGWVLHAYDDERYDRSWLVHSTAAAQALLQRFLRLEHWRDDAGDGYNLDNWKTLAADAEAEVILSLADRLQTADIMHVVRPTLFTPPDDKTTALLIPIDQQRAAEALLAAGRAAVVHLRRQAEEAHAAGDAVAELAAYDELSVADGDNHAVHYNRGVALLEADRPEDAVAAFMEAAACGLARIKPELSLRSGPVSGGILGLVGVGARLLGRAVQSEDGPGYPDWFDDAEMRMLALLDSLGDRTDLLHSLASLASSKGDTSAAAERYHRILLLNPDDNVAAFQLQYLARD